MRALTKKQISSFRKVVYVHFAEHGRDLPWRKTNEPYHILVSEVMLQQTQVDRVKGKYDSFLAAFPTVDSLASATLKNVIKVWQGLGYNRRAKYLRDAAQIIVEKYNGEIPSAIDELESLPGVGPATARSIASFAYNVPAPFIETNVRSVFLHHFFEEESSVSDKELFPYVEQTLDTENPRRWYNALMDYGVHLKKVHKNPSRRSRHYVKQSPFKGSDREVRGAVIRLLGKKTYTIKELQKMTTVNEEKLQIILKDLKDESFIKEKKSRISLV